MDHPTMSNQRRMQDPETLTYATLDLSALLSECWLAILTKCLSVSVVEYSEGAHFGSPVAEPETVPAIVASPFDYPQHSPSAGSYLPSSRPIIWQPPCIKARWPRPASFEVLFFTALVVTSDRKYRNPNSVRRACQGEDPRGCRC